MRNFIYELEKISCYVKCKKYIKHFHLRLKFIGIFSMHQNAITGIMERSTVYFFLRLCTYATLSAKEDYFPYVNKDIS